MFNQRVWKCAKTALSFVLSFCIIIGTVLTAPLPASAETLTELRKKQTELAGQKDENDERLAQLKEDVTKKREYRDDLNGQIQIVQEEIENFRQQIELLNEKIAEAEDAIALKKAGIDKSFDLLKERIKALYISGESTMMTILLDSNNLMDYADKAEMLKAITAHDNKLIDDLTQKMNGIQDELDEINADKDELSEKKKAQDKKCAELGALYEEAQKLLIELEDQEAMVLANSEILGAQMEENEAAITELEEELKKQYGDGGSTINLGGTGYEGTGSFIWPMPGYTYITCYYGDGGHRGIDIAGGDIYGKSIVAADSGFVEYAGWNDSYGYCVFINHGNGYQTRYAHMSALGSSTGAYVSAGETIGFVGSTGNSTGPHLHFEVIYNGGTTNPFSYF